jgi:DNA modification methylase
MAELAEWDTELLSAELEGLAEEGIGLEDVGFDADYLKELGAHLGLLKGNPEADAEPQIDKAEELRAKWGVEPGQLWELGDHRLLCGDSTKKEDVDRVMESDRASLCFTSPPYNLGSSVKLRNGARSKKDSAYQDDADCDSSAWIGMMREFVETALNVCEVVAVNVQMLAGNKIQLCELLGEWRNAIVDVAVWSKTNPPPAMAEGVMTSAFEFILILSQEEKPSRRIKSASFKRGTFENVITSGTASGHDASVHGAVFPTKVASHCISGWSHKDSAILEPFSGSGTTIIACEQLGRKCRAIEISPAYVAVALQRWADATGKTPRLVP